jgi:hypothetical protein
LFFGDADFVPTDIRRHDPGHFCVFEAQDVSDVYDQKGARSQDRKMKSDYLT